MERIMPTKEYFVFEFNSIDLMMTLNSLEYSCMQGGYAENFFERSHGLEELKFISVMSVCVYVYCVVYTVTVSLRTKTRTQINY